MEPRRGAVEARKVVLEHAIELDTTVAELLEAQSALRALAREKQALVTREVAQRSDFATLRSHVEELEHQRAELARLKQQQLNQQGVKVKAKGKKGSCIIA